MCSRAAFVWLFVTGGVLLFRPALVAQPEPVSEFANLAKRAEQARNSNRLSEAVALYNKALALRPDWAEGWWYVGTLLYDRDDYAYAASALKKAVALSPDAGGFAMLGLCEAKLGRNQDALQHIERGWSLGAGKNPNLREVLLYAKGNLLLEAGEFGKAQDTLDLLVHDGSDQEEAILALGLSVLGIKPSSLVAEGPAAREIVRRAGWAEHFAANRDFRAAAREYGSLAADAPKFHNVQFAYGRFLLATHQDEKAVEAFQREIANDPEHLLARLGIAGIKAKTDPAGGLPYAEEAVRLAPHLAEAHYLLGLLLLETGKTARAITELEIAKRSEPETAKIYFALGRAYAKANRQTDAARARAMFARLNQHSEQ